MGKKNRQKTISVGFVALGCAKNIVDSEKMLAGIGEAGFVITGDVDNADVVVINTCGFIKPAKDEAIDAIRQSLKQKQKGKVKKVIVAGCLAQRMGEGLLREVKGIDAIAGVAERENIARIIKKTISQSQNCELYLDGPLNKVHDDRGRLLLTPSHWAYLRIAEGCSRKCSFCTIPGIRGPFRSKPEELIISEARELVSNGAVELSIIAQDSNFYGKDLQAKEGLSKLIEKLETIDGLKWIRLMYLYPATITDHLIEVIANSKKVLNYIDIPAQHINNNILKAMQRNDRKEKILELIEKLRIAMPDVALRTTVIVGFPGEKDAQFEELLDFVRFVRFDALGCFSFYPEEGTGAAKMPDQVPEPIKKARAEALMLTQQEIAFTKGKEQLGEEYVCLVDEIINEEYGYGRFFGQAPHIDGVCVIKNCSAKPGEFIKIKVIDTKDYDLVVEEVL